MHKYTYKLNRSKRLTRTTHELYLHKTVPCSFECCSAPFKYTNDSSDNNLSTFSNIHYVIPTQEVLTTYAPLFEIRYVNAIVPQSVLDECRGNANYRRVCEAIKGQFVMYNNFFEETYVEEVKRYKKIPEDTNSNVNCDRNNEVNIQSNIRMHKINNEKDVNVNECNNYLEKNEQLNFLTHNNIKGVNDLKQNNDNPDCVKGNIWEKLVFNDASLYDLSDFSSPTEYIRLIKVFKYYVLHTNRNFLILTLKNIHLYPSLFSKNACIQDLLITAEREKTEFVDYYEPSVLQQKLKEGKIIKGVLYVNNYNCFSGIVHGSIKGRTVRVRIIGRSDMNRAMHLNVVYIEIVDQNTVTNEVNINGNEESCNFDQLTRETIVTDHKNKSDVKTDITGDFSEVNGKVVGIYSRPFTPIVGTIDKGSITGSGSQYVLVIPLDRKLPKIRIRTSQVEDLEGKRIVVKMNEWEKDSYYPFGSYIRRLGTIGDEKSEIESILIMNGIDYKNYEKSFGIKSVINNLKEKIKFYEQSLLLTEKRTTSAGVDKINPGTNSVGEKKRKLIKDNNKNNNDSESNNAKNIYSNNFFNKDAKSLIIDDSNNNNPKDLDHGDNNNTDDVFTGELDDLYDCYEKVLQYESMIRQDFRDETVISIDPPGCTDIDDALHCKIIGDKIEVGVHIADVSFFIQPKTILDKEAQNRGTTVYLTDRRLDMIPTYLSSDLCSLIEEKDRLSFSVIFIFDKDFNITEKRFHKSVIKSKKSFTYEEAQNIMQGYDNPCTTNEIMQLGDNLGTTNEMMQKHEMSSFDEKIICITNNIRNNNLKNDLQVKKFRESINVLNNIAKKLKRDRYEKGALELSSNELNIRTKGGKTREVELVDDIELNNGLDLIDKTNNNNNNINSNNETINADNRATSKNETLPEIEKIEQKSSFETNSLVEEFMLLANVAVAEKLYQTLKDSSLLRRHPKFADDSFDELKEYLEKRSINLNCLTSRELNESIQNINDNQFREMIKKIITRSMNQAVYFSSGSVPYEEFFHYGLAMPIYTHFTSPIRRYADLIVHRQLEYVIYNGENNIHNKGNDTRAYDTKTDIRVNDTRVNDAKTDTEFNDTKSNTKINDTKGNDTKIYDNTEDNYSNFMYDNNDIEEICRNINFRNRSAMYAGLDCDKLFTYLYLKEGPLIDYGYIIKVRPNGMVVYIPALGIEDTIVIEYDFDEENNCYLINGKRVFGLYDQIKVKVQQNDEMFFVERHFDIQIINE
ncbi:exosome catalytic subunit dis3 [Conglomerata obtusa]